MARLPTPGGDDGSWGDVLNDFLSQEHNTDGTQKALPQSKITNLVTDLADKASKSLNNTFLADNFFKSGRPFISSGSFVSSANLLGTGDSGPALREMVAEACSKNCGIFLDPGVYLISTLGGTSSNIALPLTRGIPLFANPGTVTLKIDASLLAWRTIIGVEAHSTIDLTGLHVSGITFDAQSTLNPSTVTNASQSRYMVSAYKGQWIKVTNCWFKNQTGRNIVSIVGFFAENVIEDAEVAHNLFTNIGSAYWHDHATTYLDANRARHHHNTYIAASHSNGTWSNAWSPYEIHGQSIENDHNIAVGFAGSGLLVSSRTGDIGGKPLSLVAHHNIGYNVGSGMGLNMQQSASDYDVHHNEFHIALDQWPAAAAATNDPNGPYPGLKRTGYALQAGALTATRWRIAGKVRYLSWTSTPTGDENAFRWERANRNPVTDTDVFLDLEVVNCPSSAVRVEQMSSLVGWRIKLQGRNLGVAALGNKYQAVVSLGNQIWSGTRPTGLLDMLLDLDVSDDQVTHTLMTLLHIDDPVSRTVSVTTNGTTTIQMVGTTHDLGSLIVHPNLPANTYITAVATFASGSSFDATAFTVSAAATGSSTANAMVTTQPPTADTVELRARWYLLDGKTIPPARLQTGQSIYIPSTRFQHFSVPDGTGSVDVGSSILDRPTGILRTQIDAPSGNNWALPDSLNPLKLATPPAAWYDAASMNLADASTATQWTDLSGNSRHAPVVAGGPTFRRSAINGYPVMRFAVSDAFKVAFTLVQPETVFVVAKHRVSTGTQTLIDGNTLNGMVMQKNSSHILQIYAGSFLIGTAPGLSWFIGAGVYNGATSSLRQNGGAGVTGAVGAANGGGITIGTNASAASGFDGDIAEVIVFPAALSLTDINTIGRYLGLKYGLTWSTAV